MFLLPTALILAGPPLGNFLGQTPLSSAPSFSVSAGILITYFLVAAMTRELNGLTGGKLVAWHYLIPIYGLYWAAVLLPRAMASAKQKAGKAAPRSALAYVFLCVYAFASDLNDLV